MTEIRGARHVIIGSYQYDHPGITTSLLGRLEGRDAFDLTVMVDRGCFDARTPYRQRGRLDRLRRACAEIILCRGLPPYGSFHTKAVVIDRRVAFLGSANLTYAADHANEELCWRLRGPPVLRVLARLEAKRRVLQVELSIGYILLLRNHRDYVTFVLGVLDIVR